MKQQKSRVSAPEPSRRVATTRRPNTGGGNRQPTHKQISERAFEIYLSRGSAGDAVADWLQAERELSKRV